MMRLLDRLASPRVLPLLLASGVAAYVVVAAVQDEALTLILSLIRQSVPVQLLLCLLPLTQLLRMARCLRDWRWRRRILQGKGEAPSGFRGDTVVVAGAIPAAAAERLVQAGYRVTSGSDYIAASRGWSSLPVRAAGCLAVACLSGGLVLSIAGREVRRVPLIAGEPLPAFLGGPGRVEAVTLRETPSARVFARLLTVRASLQAGSELLIPMFPATRVNGWWYYPRFLGLAPLIGFAAADPRVDLQDFHLLTVYPPGREDTARIPGTPYRVVARLAEQGEGSRPEALQLRIMRDDTLLGAGTVAVGGSIDFNGGRLTIPELRQFVTVDFVRDAGLPFIWLGMGGGVLALLGGLAVRLASPRREILLRLKGEGQVHCWSMAEGRKQRHNEMFHSLLDQIAVK